MAFYKKIYNKKTSVYYPLAVTWGKPVDTEEVAKRLALISTVSKSDVAAVLGDLASVIADFMKQGKSVRLDGLGTFRLTLNTKGVTQEADFNFQKQLKGVRVQFTPEREGAVTRGGTQTRSLVPADIEWVQIDGSGAASEGEGTGSGGTGGTGSDDGTTENPLG